jgi:hypothetical protein
LVLATTDKQSLVGNVDGQSEWDRDDHRRIGETPYVAIAPDYGACDRITGSIKRVVSRSGRIAGLIPAPENRHHPHRRALGRRQESL